jgi:hypothetical protein
LLFPDNEVYVSEIEKSIYNAGIGNQLGSSMVSYWTVLEGKKQAPVCPPERTCCEGQGTRLHGSLPEYLYSLSPRGISRIWAAFHGCGGQVEFRAFHCILNDPAQASAWLKPVSRKPLHYQISTDKGYWVLREDEAWAEKTFEYMPYYEVPQDQEFTAFPVVQNNP